MQQETNTSIEILVELAIADAVFETGGDKHTSYLSAIATHTPRFEIA